MPYPNEHACRVREPSEFQADSFRRIKQGRLVVIIGRPKGQETTATQAYRYPVDDWTESSAHSHCSEHEGRFEAASGKMLKTLLVDLSWMVSSLTAMLKKASQGK